MALPDVPVNDAASVAEDVSVAMGTPVGNAAEVVSIAEFSKATIPLNMAGSGNPKRVSYQEITMVDIYIEPVIPMKNARGSGWLNVSVQGTFVGTAVLQRSFDDGATWHTVATYTAVTETYKEEKEIGVRYRMGVTAYTSGTIKLRLGVGGA